MRVVQELDGIHAGIALVERQRLFLIILFSLQSAGFNGIIPKQPEFSVSQIVLNLGVQLNLLTSRDNQGLIDIADPTANLAFSQIIFQRQDSFNRCQGRVVNPTAILMQLRLIISDCNR